MTEPQSSELWWKEALEPIERMLAKTLAEATDAEQKWLEKSQESVPRTLEDQDIIRRLLQRQTELQEHLRRAEESVEKTSEELNETAEALEKWQKSFQDFHAQVQPGKEPD